MIASVPPFPPAASWCARTVVASRIEPVLADLDGQLLEEPPPQAVLGPTGEPVVHGLPRAPEAIAGSAGPGRHEAPTSKYRRALRFFELRGRLPSGGQWALVSRSSGASGSGTWFFTAGIDFR